MFQFSILQKQEKKSSEIHIDLNLLKFLRTEKKQYYQLTLAIKREKVTLPFTEEATETEFKGLAP